GARANIAAAVAWMPTRRGKDGHVHVFARSNVLKDGARLDVLRGEGRYATDLLAPGVRDFLLRQAGWNAEGQGDAIGCAETVDQHAKVRVVARDLVEQRSRRLR